ncbi:hypothetical protein PVL29_014672 [Vitis rotundifolia]|uniref:NADH:quinone oxidoreductase/Mrp antiporter membrane subunit domain-containing protein n=1 Tax=Vitis rotundifolia TaxID=103349 RepID=A0AA38ZHF1_VITRO|nr:hypothetical protein PVL29_014672 [Vitis rotundifolia]
MMSFSEFFTKPSTNLVLNTFLFCIEFVTDMSAIPFTFFIMWELELIPIYLLLSLCVGGREGKKHLYLATKFILYTEESSIFLLLGVLGIDLYGSNEPILNFETLANQLYLVALEIILYIGFYYYFCYQINNYPTTYMVTKQPWRSTL